MKDKVVVDKDEIDRLIRLHKFDDACEHIKHVRDVIELVVVNRIELLLQSEAIKESEKETFYKLIKNNVIRKLLEDEDYILINEDYVNERRIKLEMLKERRKIKI